ncbi:group II intron reverse transcriptase domain-containing protein [Wohlfahrtiimonas chitiniclastica]|uniref:antiviral reverse transcriptase Drt2 n=1 Tax=Wohlfahrtiimonas chitiniclastica TaxID=400946 RepID=UPI001BD0C05D|nr:antiviral reverse transcriptase Drt2 [Wohlfahrtiimonas chitiniclastica]MBS7821459.1 group II intron reverse transcriptase domain-containing protein [Wohlfahrtiimonas chitiniclastica]
MKNQNLEWFKKRSYLHFDEKVGPKIAEKIVTNPQKVSQHSFYPMLRYNSISTKIKKDAQTGKLIKEKKPREITYSSHIDAHIYSYYGKILERAYEQQLSKLQISECVLAFRKLGKSNIDFSYEAFNEINKISTCHVVALDISGFFNNLDHTHLKDIWARILNEASLPSDHYSIYKSLTKYSYCKVDDIYEEFKISPNNPWYQRQRICSPIEFRNRVRKKGLITIHKDTKGIPQGTAISALLSNIFMLDFDVQMHKLMTEYNGSYRRYCDDMLFIYPPTQDIIDVEKFVSQEIASYSLSINNDKTEKRFFQNGISDKPLQYLGFTYDGTKILLRSAALAKFSSRMNKSLRLVKRTIDTQSKGLSQRVPLRRKKIYERYSHLGNRNFIRYGLRASQMMDSHAIKKQLRPLWNRLNTQLDNLDKYGKP